LVLEMPMRMMLIALAAALACSGCASPAEDPQAGQDTAARGDRKLAHCGMHAAHAAHAGQAVPSAPGHGPMKHCAHMQAQGEPARP
jgi:hypothetical protein